MTQQISDSVRKSIQKRANDRCEYCQKPNKISTYSYHVDHIIPLKHGGSSKSDNLAWACFECNVSKGRDISSYDESSSELTPLFNPRKQQWSDHFKINKDAEITPITAVARVTVRILSLNDIDRIQTRKKLMQLGLW